MPVYGRHIPLPLVVFGNNTRVNDVFGAIGHHQVRVLVWQAKDRVYDAAPHPVRVIDGLSQPGQDRCQTGSLDDL